MTQSADTLRDMQILRCKISKRQDYGQYYSTEFQRDTIQEYDTRQNPTINDEAVTMAEAKEFFRRVTVPGVDTFYLNSTEIHCNAMCVHYNM